MKCSLVVNQLNDPFYIDYDADFAVYIINRSKEKGLLEKDADITELDANLVMQLFSPLVLSQWLLIDQRKEPCSTILCPNGFCFVFKHVDDLLLLAINGDGTESEAFLHRKLQVFITIMRFMFGPVTEEGGQDQFYTKKAKWDFLRHLMQNWSELVLSEQSFLAEAIERVHVNQLVNEKCVEVLEKSVKQFQAARDHPIQHAVLLVHNKLLAMYSKRTAHELQAKDILTLIVLAKTMYPSTDRLEDLFSKQYTSSDPIPVSSSHGDDNSDGGEDEYHSAPNTPGGNRSRSPSTHNEESNNEQHVTPFDYKLNIDELSVEDSEGTATGVVNSSRHVSVSESDTYKNAASDQDTLSQNSTSEVSCSLLDMYNEKYPDHKIKPEVRDAGTGVKVPSQIESSSETEGTKTVTISVKVDVHQEAGVIEEISKRQNLPVTEMSISNILSDNVQISAANTSADAAVDKTFAVDASEHSEQPVETCSHAETNSSTENSQGIHFPDENPDLDQQQLSEDQKMSDSSGKVKDLSNPKETKVTVFAESHNSNRSGNVMSLPEEEKRGGSQSNTGIDGDTVGSLRDLSASYVVEQTSSQPEAHSSSTINIVVTNQSQTDTSNYQTTTNSFTASSPSEPNPALKQSQVEHSQSTASRSSSATGSSSRSSSRGLSGRTSSRASPMSYLEPWADGEITSRSSSRAPTSQGIGIITQGNKRILPRQDNSLQNTSSTVARDTASLIRNSNSGSANNNSYWPQNIFLETPTCLYSPYNLHTVQILPGITLMLLSQAARHSLADVMYQIIHNVQDLMFGRRIKLPRSRSASVYDIINSLLGKLHSSLRKQKGKVRSLSLEIHERWENDDLKRRLLEYLEKDPSAPIPPELESPMSELYKKLKELFCHLFLSQIPQPPQLFEALSHLRLRISTELEDYREYLNVKAQRNITMTTYIDEFPGLIHFIFINRRFHQMTAPSLNISLAAGQNMDATSYLKNKIWTMYQHMIIKLTEGYTTVMMRDGDFYFSYFLWFEDYTGNPVPVQESFKPARKMPYPGILCGSFHRDLVQHCFPHAIKDSVHCFEVFLMHLGTAHPQYIASHCKQLAHKMWEMSGETYNSVGLL